MCTSIVVNKKKTIVGWNLDIMDFVWRVRTAADGVTPAASSARRATQLCIMHYELCIIDAPALFQMKVATFWS